MKTIKKCIICEREFNINNAEGRRIRNMRNRNSVTCCKRCSRIFTRVFHYVHSFFYGIKNKDKLNIYKLNKRK